MRKAAAGAAIGLAAALIVVLLAGTGAFDRFELSLYDWRMRTVAAMPPDVHPDIVLVEINDTTIRDTEEVFGRWPWPRVAYSLLIDFLSRAPAKVIAVDFGFWEKDRVLAYDIGGETWSGTESDAALAAAVQRSPSVVLLADAVYEGLRSGEQANAPPQWRAPDYRLGPRIFERRAIVPPFGDLADAAALGHNFVALDPAGGLRRMPPFVRQSDRYMPSLGMAAALRAMGIEPHEVALEGNAVRIRDRIVPLLSGSVKDAVTGEDREQLTMLVNYRAPTLLPDGKRPYTTYEARHILNSELQLLGGGTPDVDPAALEGKIVFIGLTASGLVDVFQSPFDTGGQGRMPGIQVHASVADSVLSNAFIRPAGGRWRIGAAIGLALLVGVLTVRLPFAAATPAAVLVMVGWTVYAVSAFRGGVWLDLSQPMLAMGLALFGGTAYQYFVEGREKRVVKRLFGRYVSKDVYQQLLAHPERAELGGTRRDMSVLFSDIRGFTSVTEKGDPEALVAQLNEYFSRMVDIVFRYDGTVDKFVGDMVMALYGAPLDLPSHADQAVESAVEMVRELGELNRQWAAEGRPQLDIGIGVNSGEMIAGNIGSSSIMSYTVIGDNVNLGARLESLNKDYRTRIIISDATRAALTRTYDIRPLGDVVVKGKTRPVAIFEIRVPSPLPADQGGAPV